jgi:hypothetical protein
MAIETLNIDKFTVEELVTRLQVAKERYDLSDSAGSSMACLDLTEEELVARVVSRL